MDRIEPKPSRDLAALLVFGTGVEKELLEELSIQFELFLEAVDRGMDAGRDPDYEWRVRDPSFRGQRVLLEPTPASGGNGRSRPPGMILDEARQGIALVTGSTRRPPRFSDPCLDHLAALIRVLERPEVTRMAFYANRDSEPITEATLANLRTIRRR